MKSALMNHFEWWEKVLGVDRRVRHAFDSLYKRGVIPSCQVFLRLGGMIEVTIESETIRWSQLREIAEELKRKGVRLRDIEVVKMGFINLIIEYELDGEGND